MRLERNLKSVASWKQSIENIKRKKLTIPNDAESKIGVKREDRSLTIGFDKGKLMVTLTSHFSGKVGMKSPN